MVVRAFMGRSRGAAALQLSGVAPARREGADHGRLYAVATGGFIALTFVGAVALIWLLRTAELLEVQRNLDRLSTVVTEQLSRSLQVVDITLQDTIHRVEIAAVRAGVDPEAFLDRPELRSILLEHLSQIGQLDSLTLVNADGQAVNTSRAGVRLPIYVGDRDSFLALQQNATPDLYVTPPIISRATNTATLFFSRRLEFGTPSFKGVMQGSMPLVSLIAYLRQAAATPSVAITLERSDHTLIAHIAAARSEAGSSQSMMSAAHNAGAYGLRLIVSMNEYDALAKWRKQAAVLLVATATVSACLLMMLLALLRQLRAARVAQAALTGQNEELESARTDLVRQTARLEEAADALRTGEKLLAERSATLNTTLEYIAQGIMMVDASGRVRVYNKRVAEMLELPETLLARSPLLTEVQQYQLDQGEFAGADKETIDLVRSGASFDSRQVYQRERPNGTVIEFSTLPLPGGGFVRTYTDITDLRRAQEKIERTALFDELTGLPNRLSLHRTLGRQLANRTENAELGLFYINLDRFRLLNDARGHDVGDQILVEVGRRLRESGSENDFFSRTGGDEFAIIRAIPPDHADEWAFAQRLLRLLGEAYVIDGRRVALTASIGVAVSTPRASPDVLLRNSEIAMYRAKDGGGNQLCRYEAAMAAAQKEQFQLEQLLRESLGTAAFRLVYQPIISLESNEITGFEALLRWTDRLRGEVPPTQFIPIAEATGLIVPLGRSVLEWACLEAAGWSDQRTVAVNLSPAQFQGGALPRVVRDVLAQSGLPAERLELEVTEGMLLEDTGPVHETMFALRDIGVSLTLDDFGTGHAGLSYLRRFPFSKIKIDRSFIRNLGTGGESDVIVEEMLSLGRRLNMRVVAEGVELDSQLERLRDLGCAYVQGYLTGRPVSPEVARHL